MHAQAGPVMVTLGRQECFGLLRSVEVGRIGLSVDALPIILPVNFRLHGEAIIIRSAPGTKLTTARRGNVVAFEADFTEADGSSGWSVLVRGTASEVSDPALLLAAEALNIRVFALAAGQVDRFIRIEPTIVSGRQYWTPSTTEKDV